MGFNKGDRVEIKPGEQGAGVTGEVFWIGTKKWGDGERLGVRGDDGDTYWIDDTGVEKSTKGPPPPDPSQTFSKGDRVSFKSRGREGRGRVFWIGESRHGPGQRLGIDDDDGEEAVWLDARFARALDPADDSAPAAAPAPASGGYGGPSYGGSSSNDDDADIPWTPPLDMNAMPAPPPMDDSWIDSMAAAQDAEEDAPW